MMTDVFTNLLIVVVAHLISNFALPSPAIVKDRKSLLVSLFQALIASITAAILLGQFTSPLIGIVFASNILIQLLKRWQPDNLWSFFLSQGLHLLALYGGCLLYSDAVQTGWWFSLLHLNQKLIVFHSLTCLGGFILATNVAGTITALVVKPLLSKEDLEHLDGLPNGGRIIGNLERALVMLLMWIGQPAGIGFLITAKSILRFGDIKEAHQRKVTEYVIIGTFLSFGLAILAYTVMIATLNMIPLPL